MNDKLDTVCAEEEKEDARERAKAMIEEAKQGARLECKTNDAKAERWIWARAKPDIPNGGRDQAVQGGT